MTQDTLGCLIWWRVGQVQISHEDLESALAGTGASVPARPLPIDVFRRLTGEFKKSYPLETHTLEMTLAKVESKNDSMLVRHIVGTVKNNTGATQMIRKAGDVAFYKAPRNQQSKARMRVLPGSEWPHETADFVGHLRAEYARGILGAIDSQAIRRVVRNYLADQGAIYLDGPYFIKNESAFGALERLFAALGEDSTVHMVPLIDTLQQREWLAQHSTQEVTA